MTFMWAMVCRHRRRRENRNKHQELGGGACAHLVAVLLHVAGVGVALHDLELLQQRLFAQVLLEMSEKIKR